MKTGVIKISAVSPVLRAGAPKANAGRIAKHLIDGFSRGAGLIAFPELAIGGAGCGRLYLHPRFLSECEDALRIVLSASKGRHIIAVFGMPLAVDGMVFNAALTVCDGEILGVTAKDAPCPHGVFAPLKALPPSVNILGKTVEAGSITFKSEELSIGVAIGEDALFPPDTAIAVNISSAPALLCFEERKIMQAKLFSGGVYVYVSDDSPYEYGAGSGLKIISECGRVAASAGSGTDTVTAQVHASVSYAARLSRPENRFIGLSLRAAPEKRAHPFNRAPFALSGERECLSAFDILVRPLYGLMRRRACDGLSLEMKEDAPSYAALALIVKLSAKYGINRRNFHVTGSAEAAEKYGFAESGENPVLSLCPVSFTQRALGQTADRIFDCYPFALTPLTTVGSLAGFFCRCEHTAPALAYPETPVPPELADFLLHQLFGLKTDGRSAVRNADFAFPELDRAFIEESCGTLLRGIFGATVTAQPAFKLHDFPFEHLLSAPALYYPDFFN